MIDRKLIPALLLTFVNTLGFSILIPVLPFVVKDYGASEIVFGILLSAYSSFQFLAAPFLGALSDYWGRKPVLLITQLGTLLSWVLFATAAYFESITLLGLTLSIWVIGLARMTDGITGGNASVTNAYISDITDDASKTASFGVQGAVFGVGMIIGPAIGGLTMNTSFGYIGTAFFAIALSSVTLLSIWLSLQESLPLKNRTKSLDTNFWNQINIWKKIRRWKDNQTVQTVIQLRFVLGFVLAGYTSVISLYLIDAFNFNEQQVAYFLAFVGSFMIFNQMFVVKRVVAYLGAFPTLLFGLGLLAIGLIGMTLAETVWFYTVIYYLTNLGVSLIIPTVLAVVTIQVEKSEQGSITGVIESISAFSLALAPLLAGWGYYHLDGYIFALFGAVTALALVGFWWGYKYPKTA